MYSTRQEMRAALRFRLFDTAEATFSDVQLNRQLNLSAQFVTIVLAGNSRISHARGEVEITPSPGGSVAINVTDFHSPISLQSTMADVYGKQVDEREFTRAVNRQPRDYEFLFCITYDPDTEAYSLKTAFGNGFETTGAVILAYNRRITILDPTDDGADDDLETYPTIPFCFREWPVAHAAAVLATQAGLSNAQALLGNWNALQDTYMRDARTSITPPTT